MGNVTVSEVAVYFRGLCNDEYGDVMTNLKLQKLLYYAQGFHLAIFNKPLFDNRIAAWTHGPVVVDAYHDYKRHEAREIPYPDQSEISHAIDSLDEDQRGLLDEVYDTYGQFSAWKLRNMTHDEPPWKNTPLNSTISLDCMKEYFETLVV